MKMAKKKQQVIEEVDYKNSKIQVVADPQTHAQELHIDDRVVHVERDDDTGAYYSPELPYQTHGSIQELAKALIDKSAQ